MALLDAKQFQFGRQSIYACTVGSADLPTTNPNGVYALGDVFWNISGTVGQPMFWVCTNAGSTPTFTAQGNIGVGGAITTISGAAGTLSASNIYILVTAASAITLPAPSTALAGVTRTIKATAQPVTISPASGNLDGSASAAITLSTNEAVNVLTDGVSWYSFVGDPPYQVNAPTPPATLTVRDRYVISGAGALTIPAAASWVIGRPLTVHATASSVTITPASGNIDAAAAVTLTAAQTATIISDGAALYRVGS